MQPDEISAIADALALTFKTQLAPLADRLARGEARQDELNREAAVLQSQVAALQSQVAELQARPAVKRFG